MCMVYLSADPFEVAISCSFPMPHSSTNQCNPRLMWPSPPSSSLVARAVWQNDPSSSNPRMGSILLGLQVLEKGEKNEKPRVAIRRAGS